MIVELEKRHGAGFFPGTLWSTSTLHFKLHFEFRDEPLEDLPHTGITSSGNLI